MHVVAGRGCAKATPRLFSEWTRRPLQPSGPPSDTNGSFWTQCPSCCLWSCPKGPQPGRPPLQCRQCTKLASYRSKSSTTTSTLTFRSAPTSSAKRRPSTGALGSTNWRPSRGMVWRSQKRRNGGRAKTSPRMSRRTFSTPPKTFPQGQASRLAWASFGQFFQWLMNCHPQTSWSFRWKSCIPWWRSEPKHFHRTSNPRQWPFRAVRLLTPQSNRPSSQVKCVTAVQTFPLPVFITLQPPDALSFSRLLSSLCASNFTRRTSALDVVTVRTRVICLQNFWFRTSWKEYQSPVKVSVHLQFYIDRRKCNDLF